MSATLRDIRPFIRVAHHYRFSPASNTFERHRLGYCYAFHLFDAGRGMVTIRDRSFPLNKGTLVFIPPTVPHSFYTEPNEPMASYNIYFELWPDRVQTTGIHLAWDPSDFDPSYLTQITSCPELESLPYVTELQTEHIFKELFGHIVRTHLSNNLYRSDMAHSLLYSLVLELFNTSRKEQVYDYRIQKLLTYMDEHPESRPDFDEWMRQCGLKKTQFYERFREVAGMTPGDYALRARMRLASAVLVESNLSVTEIADSLGYTSIHYFSQQFKDYYGCSPKEFRHHRISP